MTHKEPFRRYHEDGTLPDEQEVFVFGSNEAGRHGKGAAQIALMFGAKRGVGRGLCGYTYAIPTKTRRIITRDIKDIIKDILEFVEFTKNNPNLSFFVTAVGCGYAGFRRDQIAPHFKQAINCSFPLEWMPYLEDSYGID